MSKKGAIETIIDKFHPELFFISEAEVKLDNRNWSNIEGYKLILSETIHWGKSRLVCYIVAGSSLTLLITQ